MDFRVGSIPQDPDRYSGDPAKKKRVKAKGRQPEEEWSERSDHEEIEDCYAPSEKTEAE